MLSVTLRLGQSRFERREEIIEEKIAVSEHWSIAVAARGSRAATLAAMVHPFANQAKVAVDRTLAVALKEGPGDPAERFKLVDEEPFHEEPALEVWPLCPRTPVAS